jgi:hypothetical protein
MNGTVAGSGTRGRAVQRATRTAFFSLWISALKGAASSRARIADAACGRVWKTRAGPAFQGVFAKPAIGGGANVRHHRAHRGP